MKKTLTTIATIITRVGDPPWATCIYLLHAFLVTQITLQQKLLLIPLIVVLNIAVPAIYFTMLYREGKISDIDTSKRSERISLFTVTIICWSITLVFMSQYADDMLWRWYLALYIVGLFIVGITFFWKISVHAAVITLVALAFFFDDTSRAWLLAIILPVLWSRWYLKKHTIPQLVAGAALAAIVFMAIIGR